MEEQLMAGIMSDLSENEFMVKIKKQKAALGALPPSAAFFWSVFIFGLSVLSAVERFSVSVPAYPVKESYNIPKSGIRKL